MTLCKGDARASAARSRSPAARGRDGRPAAPRRRPRPRRAAPLAPMATPMSAAASAGASLTPSPIIITGPFLRSDSTTRTFLVGRQFGAHQVDRQAGGDRLRDLAPVAGRQHDALDAERAQLPQQRARCPARNSSARSSRPASLPSTATATATAPGPCRACSVRRADVRTCRRRISAPPTDDARPSTRPVDALARRLPTTSAGMASARPLPARLGDDGLRDDVLGGLVERGGKPQQLVGRDAAGRPRSRPCAARPSSGCRSCRSPARAPAPASRAPCRP